ncbi:hypothetical protein [Owenweeksia hongkongensis]|uniref:hypothetical protein n=1 Tax=Owenweeksia hongkongensis TaxID=253245 RepID=UPI003A90075C
MRIFFTMIFALGVIGLSAQKYLYIKKGNEFPKERIGLNERVTFKTSESTKFTKGILNDVTPTAITVNGKTYELTDVIAFRTRNEIMTVTGTALAGGALLFTTLGLINRATSSYEGGLTNGQWITAASFFGGGLLLRWAGKRTFKTEKGWHWEVIDLNQSLGIE